MKEFWKKWKNKGKLEKEAVKSLKVARKIILKNIPKSKIISIYVGGSFVRREMTKKSDVDTWTIVKDNKTLEKLKILHERYRYKFKPPIGISGYTIKELKTGKIKRKGKLQASPGRFVKKIKDYHLIYGKSLKSEDFQSKEDKDDFKDLIKAFREHFLPEYEKGKFGFSQLLNQVFWLTELELKLSGKNPQHSWKSIKKMAPKSHIVHEAWKFRVKRIKDKKQRKHFIIKLKKHIGELK